MVESRRRSIIAMIMGVILVVAAWWFWPTTSNDSNLLVPQRAPEDGASGPLLRGVEDVGTTPERSTRQARRSPGTRQAPPETTVIRVDVMGSVDRTRVLVRVTPENGEPTSAYLKAIGMLQFEVTPGEHTVEVLRFPGHETLGLPAPQRVVVAAGDTSTVMIPISKGRRVRIVARPDDGQEPVPVGLSLWEHGARPQPRYVDVTALFKPSEDRAWIGQLPPGRYTAMMTPTAKAGRQYQAGWADFAVTAEGATEVSVPLQAGGRGVTLELSDAEGPLQFQRMNLNRVARELRDTAIAHLVTDVSGQATSPPLPAGRYLAWVWDEQRVAIVDLTPTKDDVVRIRLGGVRIKILDDHFRIHLDPSGKLLGRMTSRNQAAVRWARSAILVPADGLEPGVPMMYATTRADGVFELDGVPVGRYRLWVPWSAFTRVRFREHFSDPIDVTENETTRVRIELELD